MKQKKQKFRPVPSAVLRLKVKLSGSKPLVWRRILVPDTYSFFDLHVAIQDAMQWHDCHLHQFFNTSRRESRDLVVIKYPQPDEDDFGLDSPESLDERVIPVTRFLKKENDTVSYEYDFGDDWDHTIMLEKILPYESGTRIPDIIAGKNKYPWEDSGGLRGYYDKIKILENKKRKDHKDVLEWVQDVTGEHVEEGATVAELADVTAFDMKEISWSDPEERLREFEKHFN